MTAKLRLGLLPAVALALAVAACSDSVTGPPNITPGDTTAPALLRELRGVWIATVANIDWPSRAGLTADQQKAELVDLLDRAAAAGMNTVVFHVRPAADAVYSSSLEPWGAMLTGTQGVDPGYDPLAFAVQEAHARGLELHAWINPFRAGNTADTLKLAANHVFRTNRSLVRVYGTNIWLDPGDPAVQDLSIRVIKDIVARYDIDGLHADDYFYPYLQRDAANKIIPFQDDSTYAKYGAGLTRDDWRRANINQFVERMYREVHAVKPFVKVGISPFGIWRPGYPAGVTGMDAYTDIYADSRKWLNQGWLDYFAPQLYWSIASAGQSYPALLNWWISENTAGRLLAPGLATYKVQDGTASAFSLQEIPNQITTTRNTQRAAGNVLYNATWTLKRNNLATTLAADLYKMAALVPAATWLDNTPPTAPTVSYSSTQGSVQLTPAAAADVRWWALRIHSTAGWTTKIVFGTVLTVAVPATADRVLVQAVDMAGNASLPAEWKRPTT